MNELPEPGLLPTHEFYKLRSIEPPKTHWFYQRQAEDWELDQFGQKKEYPVFACGEDEAARLESHKRIRFKQIGFSDGKTYFNYLREHFKPQVAYPVEEAKKIEKEAFAAELEAARGHFRRPRLQTRFFGSASQGTTGVEEFRATWERGQ